MWLSLRPHLVVLRAMSSDASRRCPVLDGGRSSASHTASCACCREWRSHSRRNHVLALPLQGNRYPRFAAELLEREVHRSDHRRPGSKRWRLGGFQKPSSARPVFGWRLSSRRLHGSCWNDQAHKSEGSDHSLTRYALLSSGPNAQRTRRCSYSSCPAARQRKDPALQVSAIDPISRESPTLGSALFRRHSESLLSRNPKASRSEKHT